MTTAAATLTAPLATAPAPGGMTLGQAVTELGLKDWQLSQLFRRKLAAEPPRLGRMRMIRPDDLPALRRAAEKAGYLQATTTAEAAPNETPAA